MAVERAYSRLICTLP